MNVSIPLEQGNVFRLNHEEVIKTEERVSIPLEQGNVFRQLQALDNLLGIKVSIPLEQGNVFRPNCGRFCFTISGFQSLWNRAMSFDCSRVFEPCVARLPRATSQTFLMFE